LPDQFSFLPYVLLATGAGVIGGAIALFWNPKAKIRSAIQHFSAGAVLAAVASNVIPEVEHIGTLPGILGGFVAGGLAMVGMKWVIVRLERKERQGKKVPVGLAAAAAADTFIDGVIISTGFSINPQLGTLLVIALALELFFLTLSVGVEFRRGQYKPWHVFLISSGVAMMLLAGSLVASIFTSNASPSTLAVILSFGAATLIYLIAEELLVETIQAEESIFSTITLFSGFLVILGLKMLS
jgi:ZIP family zinc transporter